MAKRVTRKDKVEFGAYLRGCTDRQVLGVYAREVAAGRGAYVALAVAEALRRGLTPVREG